MDRVTGLVVLMVGLGLLRLAFTQGPRRSRGAARRLALEVGLALDDATEEHVRRRLAARERAVVAGVSLGCGVGYVLSLRSDAPAGDMLWDGPERLVLVSLVLGGLAGLGLSAWAEVAFPCALPGPRVARANVPVVGDYVPGYERGGAWALVALCSGAAGVALLTGPAGEERPLRVLVLVVPVVVLLLAELLLRRLVRARQVAASAHALAWEDALRAGIARDLVAVTIWVAATLTLQLASGSGAAGPWLGHLVPVVVLVWGIVGILGITRDARGHVRRRLWPSPPTPEVPATPAAPASAVPGGAGPSGTAP